MKQERFFQILRLLYFNDDTTEPEKTNKMTDYGKWELYVTNYNMHDAEYCTLYTSQ